MLTAASSWRECTGCFCLASPFNLAFTWATEITVYLNNCPVKCAWNVAFERLVGKPYLGITSRLPVIHPRRNSDCVGTLANLSLLGYGLRVAIQNPERCRIP